MIDRVLAMCLAVISVTHEIAPACSVADRHIRGSTHELAEFKAVTAAEVLGDTVETVLRRHTHLRRANTVRDTDRFIRKVARR